MSSIDREPHRLKRCRTLAMPRRVIIFDTETKQVKVDESKTEQVLKLGQACYYRKKHDRHVEKVLWQDFRDCVSFWDFVFMRCEPKTKLWVLARNLSFDFTVVKGWKYLAAEGYKVKFFHSKGATSIISVRKGNKSILFVDVLNWFRESLATTGERLGIPKLTIDFANCSDSELNTYCKRDVEIELANFVSFIEFLESNRISRLCYTIGSTAMSAYLFGHYDTEIYIHNNAEAIQLERDGYKGGRVECFYIGEKRDETHYILDVNSLYPSVMRGNCYPVKYLETSYNQSIRSLSDSLVNNSGVAQVVIRTNEPAYAIRRERTIFPVGRFSTVLCTPELKYALERGHILNVGRCVLYEQADIFRTYVDKIYTLRLRCKAEGRAQYVEICKLLLNTLYGKFGQKADEWEKIGDCPGEPDRVELLFRPGEHRTRQIRYLLGEIFELVGHGECFNSFPAIAAHVTAYGRMYLWHLIQTIGVEHVLYCDTDSVIVDGVGKWVIESYLHETELGKLKIQEVTRKVIIHGLKDYATDAKDVLKGVRSGACEKANGVYEQEQWPSFRGTLRSGQANTYTTQTITKVLTREYTKGTILDNGSVVPFVLDEPVLLFQSR